MMRGEPLYEINNAFLAYHKSTLVVDIPSPGVKFYKDLIHFIIGPSGVGKSTLLEAIGFMTNTLVKRPGGVARVLLEKGTEIQFEDIWNSSDLIRSEFRKKHFSFLFQNNFLMPNFTVRENMALTYLMKGADQMAMDETLNSYMAKVHLSQELNGRSVSELSGGQKQRIAFLRALMASYEILFADEPTGNLDPYTSDQLMFMLREELKNGHKTAFLVSHDIRLAMKYGDVIICMLPSGNLGSIHGLVSQNHIYHKIKGVWKNEKGETMENLEVHLNKLYAG